MVVQGPVASTTPEVGLEFVSDKGGVFYVLLPDLYLHHLYVLYLHLQSSTTVMTPIPNYLHISNGTLIINYVSH